jgi:hypothetical protein
MITWLNRSAAAVLAAATSALVYSGFHAVSMTVIPGMTVMRLVVTWVWQPGCASSPPARLELLLSCGGLVELGFRV